MTVLDELVSDQLRTDLPEIASGDTVKVSAKVIEGNRERIQVFEGTVMRLRGGGITRSITVRRIASGGQLFICLLQDVSLPLQLLGNGLPALDVGLKPRGHAG